MPALDASKAPTNPKPVAGEASASKPEKIRAPSASLGAWSSRVTVPLVDIDRERVAACEAAARPLSFDFVLFLDIDGVLHPCTAAASQTFCYVDNFANALRTIDPEASVPLVICSDWRLDMTLAQLRSRFPLDIAERIVGVTPDAFDTDGSRGHEAALWMAANAPEGDWVAIDDRPRWYGQYQHKVFAVASVWEGGPGGLNEATATVLAAYLDERVKATKTTSASRKSSP